MKRIMSMVMLLPFLGVFFSSCQTQSQPGGQMGGQMEMGGMSGGGPGGQMERPEPEESTELLLRLASLLLETDDSISLTQEQKSALVPELEIWAERMEKDKKIRNRHLKRVKKILTDIQLVCRVTISEQEKGMPGPPSSLDLLNCVLEGCREGTGTT